MKITVTNNDDYVLAQLEGSLDDNIHGEFDEQLHPVIAESGSRLLLDLSGCERITSAGIGVLVTLVSRANSKGSRVVLASPSPFVSSIFSVTKLTRFFDLEDTVDAGIARLRE